MYANVSQFRGAPPIATDFHQRGLFVREGYLFLFVEADVLEVVDESMNAELC